LTRAGRTSLSHLGVSIYAQAFSFNILLWKIPSIQKSGEDYPVTPISLPTAAFSVAVLIFFSALTLSYRNCWSKITLGIVLVFLGDYIRQRPQVFCALT
jgi:hypothetical protein